MGFLTLKHLRRQQTVMLLKTKNKNKRTLDHNFYGN